jgi:hypothetical protein
VALCHIFPLAAVALCHIFPLVQASGKLLLVKMRLLLPQVVVLAAR